MTRKLQLAAVFLGVAAAAWLWWSRAREEVRPTPAMPAAPVVAAPAEHAPAIESVESVESAAEPREIAADRSVETAPVDAPAAETLLRVQVLAREDLAPQAGVRLILLRTDVEEQRSCYHVELPRAAAGECPLTDAEGWAEFECASGIPYAVSSFGAEIESAKVEALPLAPGERRELQLLLRTRDDVTLFGVLLDGETQSPVAGGELRLESGALVFRTRRSSEVEETPARRSEPPPSARADAEGRFELRGTSWKPQFARATAPGWAPTVFHIAEGHSDAADPLRVLLWRAATLDVTVSGSAGEPLVDALVVVSTSAYWLVPAGAQAAFHPGEDPRWSVRTDAQGKATLEGLMPRAPLELSTRPPNEEPRLEAQKLTLVPGERRAVEIRWGSGATVYGQVLGAEDQPLANRMMWRVVSDSRAGYPVLLNGYAKPAATARTDEQGRFTFQGVPVGMWSVGLAPTDSRGTASGEYPALAESLEVKSSDVLLEVTLRVEPSLFLRGTVVGPDRQPVTGGYVMAHRKGTGPSTSGNFNESASFSLGPLPAGTWVLSARKFGSEFARSLDVEAEAGADAIVLELRTGASISGRIVREPAGEAILCELVIAQHESQSGQSSTRSKGELFEFSGLLPGTYTVIARDRSGWVGVTPAIRLESGQKEQGREIRLQPGAVLNVRCEGERKYVNFELLCGGQRLELDQAHLGRPTPKPVPPGTIEVHWQVGETPKSRTVVLAAGETKEVVLDDQP